MAWFYYIATGIPKTSGTVVTFVAQIKRNNVQKTPHFGTIEAVSSGESV